MIKCQACGAVVQDNAKFCTECGSPMGTPFAESKYSGASFEASQQPFYEEPSHESWSQDTWNQGAGQTFQQGAGQSYQQSAGQSYQQGAGQTFQQGAGQSFQGGPQGYPQGGYNQGYPQQGNYYGDALAGQVGQKSKIAAGLLAILLGSLGVHKFYLGYTSTGVIMLLVSIFGAFAFGLGPIVMGVISLVEGIIYLTKSDADFYETYEVGQKKWF